MHVFGLQKIHVKHLITIYTPLNKQDFDLISTKINDTNGKTYLFLSKQKSDYNLFIRHFNILCYDDDVVGIEILIYSTNVYVRNFTNFSYYLNLFAKFVCEFRFSLFIANLIL